MDTNYHYNQLMNLAKDTAFDILLEKINIQDGSWDFFKPPTVACYQRTKDGRNCDRALFTVNRLVYQLQEFGDEIIIAYGTQINADGLRQSETKIIYDNILEDFLPTELEYLARLIPEHQINRKAVDKAWEEIPEVIIVKDISGGQEKVSFNKAKKTISVSTNNSYYDGYEAYKQMSKIAQNINTLKRTEENWVKAVQKWYEDENFDLPF